MGLTRTQLAAIAKATGYPVKMAWVMGHGTMGEVAGVMLHHTATPDTAPGDYPSYNIVRQGRSDLPGPLCNFGLGRSGTIYLVSEGIAWHAGPGAWRGVTLGNTHFLGVEAENGGTGRPWPAVQLDAYQRLVASILHTIGRTTDWDVRHAAWALPAGRKTDTAGIDMDAFDAAVTGMLHAPATINRNYRPPAPPAPAPAPKPTPVEDPMPTPQEYADAVWSHLIGSDWDGKKWSAENILASAQRYAVEAGHDGPRPDGKTPTARRELEQHVDARLDALEGKLDQLLAALKPPTG